MAKKAASKTNFRSLLTSIRKGEFAPVYLLMGEEAYYIDKLVEELETHVVSEEDDPEFNVSTFYGQDADLGQVIATCQEYPFMAERRLVVLKEAQSMLRAKVALEQLAPYISHPNKACVFVLVFKGDNLNATSALMKEASKNEDTVVFQSPKLRDYELTGPLSEYCREKKVAIGEDAILLLTDYIGADLSALFGAIDKLMIAGGSDSGRITPEMIAANLRASKEFSSFELQNALARKDFSKTMRIVKSFKDNPKANPVVVTVGFLFAFFSKLLVAQMCGDRTEQGMMAAIGCRSNYAFKDYAEALRRFTIPQTVNAIHLLRELDTKSKGVNSFQNEHDLLEEFVFNLFAGKGPAD